MLVLFSNRDRLPCRDAPTDNLADGFVSGNQREFSDEFTFVYVQIGTADTACLWNGSLLRAEKG